MSAGDGARAATGRPAPAASAARPPAPGRPPGGGPAHWLLDAAGQRCGRHCSVLRRSDSRRSEQMPRGGGAVQPAAAADYSLGGGGRPWRSAGRKRRRVHSDA